MSGSPAAIRVTSRTPWPESDRCSGWASASCPAVSTASRCGRCDVRATARSCSTGESRTGSAPHSRASASTSPTAFGEECTCGVIAHGRPSNSAAVAGERTGPLAAGHRVAAHVAGEQALATCGRRSASSGRLFTLPTSVTTPPRSRASTTTSAMWSGGTATTVSCAAPSAGAGRAGTETAGGADVLVVDVGEPDLETGAAGGQADRGAEQPGADHVDRADQPCWHGVTHRAPPGPGSGRDAARRRRAGRRG